MSQIIDKFNRDNVKTLTQAVEAALQVVAKEHGVILTLCGARFTTTTCTVKPEFGVITLVQDSSNLGSTAVPAGFAKKARTLGLPEDCWKRTFQSRGTLYTIEDISLNRPKYPVTVSGPQGGKYKFPVKTVKQGLPT